MIADGLRAPGRPERLGPEAAEPRRESFAAAGFLLRLAPRRVVVACGLVCGLVCGLACLATAGCALPPRPAGLADTASSPVAPPAVLAQAESWPRDVRLDLVDRGPFRFARAEIEGKKLGLILVDTGANRTVVSNGVAGRLGLEQLGEVRASGVTGWSTHRRTRLPGLTLVSGGGHPSEDEVAIELGPREALGLSCHRLGPTLQAGVGGILGFPDVASVPFSLTPAGATRPASLTLHRPGGFRPPAGATRHRLRLVQGLPMVEASVRGAAGRPTVLLDLLLDTGGSGGLSLPLEVLQRRPDLASVPVSGAGSRLGVGGPGGTTETWVRSLTTLGLTLKDVPTAFGPSPPGLAARPGRTLGRLGQGVLGQATLTFDATRGWLYVQFAAP